MAVTVPTGDLFGACQPYLSQASEIARQLRDTRISSIADYVEADVYHCLGDRRRSEQYARRALRHLLHPTYRAFAERLVLVDGTWRDPAVLKREIAGARDLINSLPHPDIRGVTHLLEGMGAVLASHHDPLANQHLVEAKTAAAGKDPVAYIMAIRTEMVAIAANPGGVDRDRLIELAGTALLVCELHGWSRRIEQLQQVAASAGLLLESRVNSFD